LSVWTVDRLTDSFGGQGSGQAGDLRYCLRGAITDGDIITFAVTGTIKLSTVLPDIVHGLSIAGPGADLLTVSGNHVTRVFNIAAAVNVAISRLTMADGQVGLGVNGGGIYNAGTLTVADCALNGNSTPFVIGGGSGGGIYNVGVLTVIDSTFSGNVAGGGGGGIFSEGTLTVADSTFSNNVAIGGGGIFNGANRATVINSVFLGNSAHGEAGGGAGIGNFGTLTVTGCTFSGNVATDVSGGGIANGPVGTVAVTDSTFSGNSAYDGGGIYNSFTLTITASTLSDNLATSSTGGAISNDIRGNLTVTHSSLIGNSARSYNGGGIGNNQGTVTITGSTLSDNSAFFDGGGIWNNYTGVLTVTNSVLSGNSARTGYGGGIANQPMSHATVSNSTFSGNTASSGGALDNAAGTVTITNSTLSNNSATGGGAIDNRDLGIFTNGTVTVTSSTLSGNAATRTCGGFDEASAGSLTVRNSIVAANTAPSSPDVCGALDSQGYNLIGDGTGGSGWTDTDAAGTADDPIDPLLGRLQDNGGPTQTAALLPGSPALNAGDPALLGTADQRGVVRRGGVNIGAYQASASAFVLSAPDQVTAGVPFDVTVMAVDPFGQLAAGYAGTVTFGTTDPDPGVVLPADYTFTVDDGGMHTFTDTGLSETTLVTPGRQTLTVADLANRSIAGSATVEVLATDRPGGGRRVRGDAEAADAFFASFDSAWPQRRKWG
jgi:predicted outer membrane repeat protein